jgi:hypothetical protein
MTNIVLGWALKGGQFIAHYFLHLCREADIYILVWQLNCRLFIQGWKP